MTQVADLLAAAAQTAARTAGIPTEPRRRLAVVTCMDSRIDVFGLFGLDLGDAHVIRNAGGRVTDDVLRSLALSSTLLGDRLRRTDAAHRLRTRRGDGRRTTHSHRGRSGLPPNR